jgi:hypothetical protein
MANKHSAAVQKIIIMAMKATTMTIIATTTTNLAHPHTHNIAKQTLAAYTTHTLRYITYKYTIPKINQIGFKFMYSRFTGIKFYFSGISLKAK